VPSGKEDEEQACPEAICRIGHQDAEGALETTHASIKAVEDDDAYGRFAATEGPVARNWTRTSTLVAQRIALRRQVELSREQFLPDPNNASSPGELSSPCAAKFLACPGLYNAEYTDVADQGVLDHRALQCIQTRLSWHFRRCVNYLRSTAGQSAGRPSRRRMHPRVTFHAIGNIHPDRSHREAEAVEQARDRHRLPSTSPRCLDASLVERGGDPPGR
jgi:hypothetical protein